jgi:DNA-binding NarL/FixJ family response regulator
VPTLELAEGTLCKLWSKESHWGPLPRPIGPRTKCEHRAMSPDELMIARDRARTSVVLGRFAIEIELGLRRILGEDRTLRVLDGGFDHEALEACLAGASSSVVLLGESGISDTSVLELLRRVAPHAGVIVLAHWPTPAYVSMLLTAGVSACLPLYASTTELLAAVRRAADPDAASQLACIESLSEREEQVMQFLVGSQATYAEIGVALCIGEETVRTHAKNIYRKRGVGGRLELTVSTIQGPAVSGLTRGGEPTHPVG